MALADPRNVEVALMRDLTETESRYVEDLLGVAERMLTTRIPTLTERAASDPTLAAVVADVEAEMLARVFRADGNHFIQEAEGNYSYRLNLQVASGLLDVLEKEWSRLGVGTWGTVGPATDGYLSGRHGGEVPPPWQFQHGWPARNDISESWWVGP